MVDLLGDVIFGNLDDEKHQHCYPESCVDAACWHRSLEGRLFYLHDAALDFLLALK
jgi:hypothetical protein